MSKGSGTTLAKFADTLALIMWEARTIRELVEVSDVPRQTISTQVRVLHAAGVIYVLAYAGRDRARVWAVQPEKPFGERDAK